MQIEVTNKRNEHGVKDSRHQYRTINGEHWIDWTHEFDDGMVAEYRAAGIKVRVIKGEMYIRQLDVPKALQL